MSDEKTIAIIGASNNREKYGNKAVRAYVDQGYTVYPVNPKEDEIEGLKSYASVNDIPGTVEIASVYLPPKRTLGVLEDIKAKGIKTVYLNPGTENDQIIQKAQELGLNAIQACSILAVGKSPAEYQK